MGTWDIGPFDNDTAADFAGDLDEAALEEHEAMVRSVLKRSAGSADFLGICDGERAVARRPWSSPSILRAIRRVRTMAHQSRYQNCLQTFECSPSTPWTK